MTEDRSAPTLDDTPVVLVHGWGGSFASTWQSTGFSELIADAGREVVGVDLLGHGTAPKPHDPAAYADLTERIVEAIGDRRVDAVGFSLGALTLLRTAIAHPGRFRKLVLAGIGQNVFATDDSGSRRILSGLDGTAPPDDNIARLFARYANEPGNDVEALAAVLRRPVGDPITPDRLAAVDCPVLVIAGDRDFVQPTDELVAALPASTSVTLRNTDHFATPESFGFIDAALEFIDAVPT